MAVPVWEGKGADFSDTSAAPGFAVPTGTSAGKVVIVSMFINVASTTVDTLPSGFAAVPGTPVVGTNNTTQKFWKRLTGSDTGTYDFGLSSAQFVEGAVELYSNCVATGLPFDLDSDSAVDNTSGTDSPPVSISTNGPDRLIIHTSTNWAGGIWTSNAGYTKRLQPPVGLVTTSDKQQSTQGSTGSIVATSSLSDFRTAHIIALIGTTAVGGNVQTISDEARANMLADRGLADPQLLSNVDLMRLVLADELQVLVPKTDATIAEHYNRYLIVLRNT